MSTITLSSKALANREQASTGFDSSYGQQLINLLLIAIPVAERTLLSHLITTAWLMLPEREAVEHLFRR